MVYAPITTRSSQQIRFKRGIQGWMLCPLEDIIHTSQRHKKGCVFLDIVMVSNATLMLVRWILQFYPVIFWSCCFPCNPILNELGDLFHH